MITHTFTALNDFTLYREISSGRRWAYCIHKCCSVIHSPRSSAAQAPTRSRQAATRKPPTCRRRSFQSSPEGNSVTSAAPLLFSSLSTIGRTLVLCSSTKMSMSCPHQQARGLQERRETFRHTFTRPPFIQSFGVGVCTIYTFEPRKLVGYMMPVTT